MDKRRISTCSEVKRYLKRREDLISGLENESFLISESENSVNMSKDSIFIEFLDKKNKKTATKRRLFQTDLNNVEVRSNNSADSQVRRNLSRKSNLEKKFEEKAEISLNEIPEEELTTGLTVDILKKVDQNVSLINASFRKNRFKPLENLKLVKSRRLKPNLKVLRKKRPRNGSYWRKSPVKTRSSQSQENKSCQTINPEPTEIICISSEEKPAEMFEFSWEKEKNNEIFSSLELPSVVITPQDLPDQKSLFSQENELRFPWEEQEVPQLEVPEKELKHPWDYPEIQQFEVLEKEFKLPLNFPEICPTPELEVTEHDKENEFLELEVPLDCPELPEIIKCLTPQLEVPTTKEQQNPQELTEIGTEKSENPEKSEIPQKDDFIDPPRNEVEVLNESLEISNPISDPVELPTPDLFSLSTENRINQNLLEKVCVPSMDELPIPDEEILSKECPVEEITDKNVDILMKIPSDEVIEELRFQIPKKLENLGLDEVSMAKVGVNLQIPDQKISMKVPSTEVIQLSNIPENLQVPKEQQSIPSVPELNSSQKSENQTLIILPVLLMKINTPEPPVIKPITPEFEPELPQTSKTFIVKKKTEEKYQKRKLSIFSKNRPVSSTLPQSSLNSQIFKRPEPPKNKPNFKGEKIRELKAPHKQRPRTEKSKIRPEVKSCSKSTTKTYFIEKIPPFHQAPTKIPEKRKEIVLKHSDRSKAIEKIERILSQDLRRQKKNLLAEKKTVKNTESIHEMYKKLKKESERRLERIRRLTPLSTIIKRNELKQNYLNKLSANPTAFTAPKQKAVEKWILDERNKEDLSETLSHRLKDFDSVASAIDLW